MNVYMIKGKGDLKKFNNLFSKFGRIEHIELKNFVDCLKKEEKEHSKECTIIVKQSTISILDPSKFYDTLTSMKEKKEDFDLYYLTTWNDACQKRRLFWKKHNIYSIFEPNGLQGVLITPRGRRRLIRDSKMLNNEMFQIDEDDIEESLRLAVMNNGLVALTSVPHIANLDHEAIVHNNEYKCYNDCRPIKCTNNPNNTSYYIWFIIAFFILIAIGWAYFFGRKRYS